MKKSKNKIPWFVKIIIQLLSNQEDHEQYIGDIEELYFRKKTNKGKLPANIYIVRQILRSAPYFICTSFIWGSTMFKNYLKIAFRNILKYKLNSGINIFGMAIGLSVCFLILMFVQNELSYDQFHKNKENVFKLLLHDTPWISPIEAKLFKEQYPEILESARFLPRNGIQVEYNEKQYLENKYAYADPALFDILTFNFIAGNKKQALSTPGNIIISEKLAQKYFGNKNPIGENLLVDNETNLNVAAVFENMPAESHFHFDFFIPVIDDVAQWGEEWANNSGWQNFHTYFLLEKNVDTVEFAKKISDTSNKNWNLEGTKHEVRYSLINITDIHLYSLFPEKELEPQSSYIYVIIFSSISLFILLIACFNYINILTANVSVRLKEVGIKKVIGVTKSQLTRQFLSEAVLQFIIAFMFSLVIVIAFLPIFNSLTSKNLLFESILTFKSSAGIIIILFLTIVIAGVYPARLISSFKPALIMKGFSGQGKSSFNLRKVLLIVQYTVSIALIITAVVMLRQINYVQSADLGYDKERIAIFEFSYDEESPKYQTLKKVLLQNSNITYVSAGARLPSTDLGNRSNIKREGADEGIFMGIVHTDYDYFETFGIIPTKGRVFSEKIETEAEKGIILNESAVKLLELGENPIGKRVSESWQGENNYLNVIGVVPDFHFESLYTEIKPAVFVIDLSECWQMVAKIKPVNVASTLSFIEDSWESFYPDRIFNYSFLDENYAALYERDQKIFELMIYFAILAVFISSLGLFGMITHSAKNRVKEIGIRKVLGAPVHSILKNLTSEYLLWIVVSFCIASPIVIYFLNKWLQNFAYRINLSFFDFITAGVIISVISFLTVVWQGIKASKANPIDSIKYE